MTTDALFQVLRHKWDAAYDGGRVEERQAIMLLRMALHAHVNGERTQARIWLSKASQFFSL